MLKLHSDAWSRPCDTCRSAASAVYCRADQAYLCAACDSRVHAANQVASRHERVRVCEACERAPAELVCKADSASLCAACDAEVHSANPLARRHHRVPIVPLYSQSSDHLSMIGRPPVDDDEFLDEDDDEAASWLLFGGTAVKDEEEDKGVFGREVDEYLDLDDYNNNNNNNNNQFSDGYSNHNQQYNSGNQRSCYGGDSVVPIQFHKGKDDHQCFQLGLEAYSAGSISHSVSLSPMDVGIVPESSMTTEISTTSHTSGGYRAPKGTIDLFSGTPIQLPSQLTGVDREARVLRYREKKKNRKFEKTIRYASRKAYAETRPRIKGRFAKRTDVEQMFAPSTESGYGVVPSF